MENDYIDIETVIVIPYRLIWKPKEDITTYELAMCLPYFLGKTLTKNDDLSPSYFRHFIIKDRNGNNI